MPKPLLQRCDDGDSSFAALLLAVATGFLIDDHDNNGPDGMLIEWASTGQMVRLPYHQLTFNLAPRVSVPVTRPGTTARAKQSSSAQTFVFC